MTYSYVEIFYKIKYVYLNKVNFKQIELQALAFKIKQNKTTSKN